MSATSPYAASSTSFLIVSSSADESPSLLAHVSSALDHVHRLSSSQPSLSPSYVAHETSGGVGLGTPLCRNGDGAGVVADAFDAESVAVAAEPFVASADDARSSAESAGAAARCVGE